MATAAQTIDAERRFYGRMALAIIIAIFIGFAPSFYLMQMVSYPRPNPPLTVDDDAARAGCDRLARDILHAGAAGCGEAARCPPAAGRLGNGARRSRDSDRLSHRDAGNPARLHPPIIDAESWSAVPLLAVPAMALLLWMGWRNRIDPQAHKRFMLVFTICMVEPGLGRWPVFPPTMAGHVISNLLAFAFIIPLVMWDRKTIGSLHWATKVAMGALAFGCFARYIVWGLGIWPAVVRVLPG